MQNRWETRVAVMEEGRPRGIHHRTHDRGAPCRQHLQRQGAQPGGWFEGCVCGHGFEKNAFLHYWDIVPSNFDSGVELVERETKKRDKPRITQKDIPRLYPPGSDIIGR